MASFKTKASRGIKIRIAAKHIKKATKTRLHACILGILSSVPLTGSNEDFVPTSVVGPTLLPESEMPSAFITCGELPEFEDKQAEQEWLKKLTELGDQLDGDDVPFWYPNGPVVSHWTGADGYYYVGIKEDLVWKLNDTMVAEIVAAINKAGRELGFEREVPVKFDLFGESVDDKARALLDDV